MSVVKRKPDQEEIDDLSRLRLECLALLKENNFQYKSDGYTPLS